MNSATLDRLLQLNGVPLGAPIAQEIRVEVQQLGTPFRTAFHSVFTRHGIVYGSVRTADEDGIDLLNGAHAGNGRASRPEQAHGRPRPSEDRREWVDQARAVPILDEINRRGIKLQGKGAEREGPCPICGGKDRFSINTAKGVFNCRKCGGKGGDTIAFVQWLDGVNFDNAIATLTGAKLNRHHEAGKKDRERRLDFKNRVTFDYHDAEGRLVYHRDRLPLLDADGKPLLSDKGKPDKEFMPRLPGAMVAAPLRSMRCSTNGAPLVTASRSKASQNTERSIGCSENTSKPRLTSNASPSAHAPITRESCISSPTW